MKTKIALVVCLLFSAVALGGSSRGPGYLLINTANWGPGTKVLRVTTDVDGRHTWDFLTETPKSGDPLPPPPNPTDLSKKVRELTAAVIDPNKEENSAGLSVIYSVVSSRYADGNYAKIKDGLEDLQKLTDGFLKARGVENAWKPWRAGTGDALTAVKDAGKLKTSAQYASALKTVADSLGSSTREMVATARRDGKGERIKIGNILKILMDLLGSGGGFDWKTILKLLLGLLG